jgi:hypothetical protein
MTLLLKAKKDLVRGPSLRYDFFYQQISLSSMGSATSSTSAQVPHNNEGCADIQHSMKQRLTLPVLDVKSRHPPKLPYKLLSNPAQLTKLPLGRRKAIEASGKPSPVGFLHLTSIFFHQFGRARALCEAYMQDFPHEKNAVPLVPVDVFRWLEDEGCFPRPERAVLILPTTVDKFTTAPLVYCAWCGFPSRDHHQGIKSEADSMATSTASSCSRHLSDATAAQFPVLDASALLMRKTTGASLFPGASIERPMCPPVVGCADLSSHLLVKAANPRLTASVHALTMVRSSDPVAYGILSAPFPLSRLGSTSEEVDSSLAPHALLGLLLTPLVRRLVQNALPHVRPGAAFSATVNPGSGNNHHSKNKRGRAGPPVVLTPYHILQGLRVAAHESTVGAALFLALARLGTGASADGAESATAHVVAADGTPAR